MESNKDCPNTNLEDSLEQLQLLGEADLTIGSTVAKITDDNAIAVRRKHQIAQAVLHVVDLDPKWRVGPLGP
jgi:hypothetical protein